MTADHLRLWLRNNVDKIPLHIRVEADRKTSQSEIDRHDYPHANRSLNEYRLYIPTLDIIIRMLLAKYNQLRGVDVGCGTGRAAQELVDAYGGMVDMIGASLIYHPPVESDAALPSERIYITGGGVPPHPRGPIHFALAVGALDTSNTIVDTGTRVLEALQGGGIFVFAPSTMFTTSKYRQAEELISIAYRMGFDVSEQHNVVVQPHFIFIKE